MPLTCDLIHSPLTPQSLNHNFNRLIKTILDVIESPAPLQSASRRQIISIQIISNASAKVTLDNKRNCYFH